MIASAHAEGEGEKGHRAGGTGDQHHADGDEYGTEAHGFVQAAGQQRLATT